MVLLQFWGFEGRGYGDWKIGDWGISNWVRHNQVSWSSFLYHVSRHLVTGIYRLECFQTFWSPRMQMNILRSIFGDVYWDNVLESSLLMNWYHQSRHSRPALLCMRRLKLLDTFFNHRVCNFMFLL